MKYNIPAKDSTARSAARIALGLLLIFTGVGHLSFARRDFQAEVPESVPMNKDTVVWVSGIGEIALAISLIFLKRQRVIVGWIVVLFFILVFPGNIAQLMNHKDALGMNTDLARTIRLFFQPVLIIWALWATGAWDAWKHRHTAKELVM